MHDDAIVIITVGGSQVSSLSQEAGYYLLPTLLHEVMNSVARDDHSFTHRPSRYRSCDGLPDSRERVALNQRRRPEQAAVRCAPCLASVGILHPALRRPFR